MKISKASLVNALILIRVNNKQYHSGRIGMESFVYNIFQNFITCIVCTLSLELLSLPPFHLTLIFKNMFLFVQSNCFDERNGFQQLSESLD